MPELPEVECVRRNLLRAGLPGLVITSADVGWAKTVKRPDAARFVADVRGRRISDVNRRGKYLIFPLSGGESATLIVHLGMTGWLWLRPEADGPDPMVRHTFHLGDGRQLRFQDGRKFGKMWLAGEANDVLPPLSPEPLEADFTTELLADKFRGRSAPIKALLLDQSIASGLGNLYADESLFLAGIHPERPASELSVDETARLRDAIVSALTTACLVYDRARDQSWPEFPDPLETWTHPRDTTQPCPVCNTNMAAIRVRARGTYFCPNCQQ